MSCRAAVTSSERSKRSVVHGILLRQMVMKYTVCVLRMQEALVHVLTSEHTVCNIIEVGLDKVLANVKLLRWILAQSLRARCPFASIGRGVVQNITDVCGHGSQERLAERFGELGEGTARQIGLAVLQRQARRGRLVYVQGFVYSCL
jgi:hypothetical protein